MGARIYPSVDETDSGREKLTYSWWWLVTAGAIALALGLAALGSLWLLARPLALLVLGITLAEAVAPLVNLLKRRMSRLLAVLLIFLVVLLVFIGLVWLIIPPLASQVLAASENIPQLIEAAQQWLGEFETLPVDDLIGVVTSQLANIGGALISLPLVIVASVFDVLFLLFVAIYWVLETPAMSRFTLSFFPRERHVPVMSVLRHMGAAMGGFVRGTVIDGAAVALLSYIGLSIIGLEFALALSLLAGVMEILPVLGPVLASIPMLAIALLDSPTQALIVLVFVLALQQFENRVLLPVIMRSQTKVSPLLVLLAVYVGGTGAGLVGALVAIPLISALRVFVIEAIAPAIRQGKGVRPEGSLDEDEEIPETEDKEKEDRDDKENA